MTPPSLPQNKQSVVDEANPMTQFSPPGQYPGQTPYAGLAPWSGTAIAGFVCSLLGCTGIGAVLGIILGIVGILDTRGGRRRGMGLAIAAIPISLIIAGVTVAGFLFVGKMGLEFLEFPARVQLAFQTGGTSHKTVAENLKNLASDDFKQAVSDEKLADWLRIISEKHGTLTEIEALQPGGKPPQQKGQTEIALDAKGKFVNGTVPVIITLSLQNPLKPKLNDIEIDGSSPRSHK
jgi:hypothetical protein